MDTHRQVTALCAAHGIAAIVQKPLAPNWAEATAIVEAAHRTGTFLAVHENFRFQDAPLRVVEILRSGVIGTPNWARIAFRAGPEVYANQPYFFTEERLVILDLGIHLLDLSRVFMGEVDDIFCRTQRRNPKVRAEDTATMLLRHKGGGVSVVESTYENHRLPKSLAEVFLEIEGDRGAIVLDRQLNLSVTSNGHLTSESLVPADFDLADPPASIARSSVRNACAHILAAFRAGHPADISGADNLRTFALVEAAYRSALTGRAEVPEAWSPG
jgi:predicted dehydrogenase